MARTGAITGLSRAKGKRLPDQPPHYHLWRADEVAARAIEAGLLDWLIARRA